MWELIFHCYSFTLRNKEVGLAHRGHWTESPRKCGLPLPWLCNVGRVSAFLWASVFLSVQEELDSVVSLVLPYSKIYSLGAPFSKVYAPMVLPLPLPKAQMSVTDWDLWFCASRFSSCLTSSRPRRHSPCLLLLSGRTSFHLWTLSTGTITTTWCRYYPPPELFLESDCWQQVFAALLSHQTVECREKLFARLIFKKEKKKSYLVAFQNR